MKQKDIQLNICIVSHNAYGIMKGGNNGHAGGVERQTSLMAQWLAAKGHRVTMIVWGSENSEEEMIKGVRVIKICKKEQGVPGIRFFYPRWTSLIQAMNKANADLYYHNVAEYVTGQIALWCKKNKRRFIYSVASDADCELKSPELKKIRDRILFKYGLRNAERIIVQTRKQQQMLFSNYNLESVMLPMPCPFPIENKSENIHHKMGKTPRIIWIGRIDKVKRLELLLDVAEELPEIIFDIVGKPTDSDNYYFQNLKTRAAKLPNVTLHGMIAINKIPDYYKQSSILCNTSLYEGFPNTFLEAWSFGLPVVSTYDPDNLITEKRLGIYAQDRSEIVSGIKTLLSKKTLWQQMSENAIQYYKKNHLLDTAMRRFEKVFIGASL